MATIDAIQYSAPTDEARAFYDENGYIVIKNAVEPIGLDRVRRAFERREAETFAEREEELRLGKFRNGYGNGPHAHTIRPDFDTDETILDLANNPSVIPYVENIVGPDYQVMEMLYHNHHAGTAAHTNWHRDWPPWTHPQYTLKIKVFYFLDDQTEDMGCFSLVPGTHTNPDYPPKEDYSGDALETMPNMEKMALNAGDAVLWNVVCWHTGCANTSAMDRRIVIYGYMPFFVKKWIANSPPQSIVNWADTPQKRQLMGIHCVTGRRSWDRTDVPYLPEHEAIAMAKNL